MGLPRFEKRDGTDPYAWEEYPSLPSDRADLAYGINQLNYTLNHTRNNAIIEREILVTKNIWHLFFYHISETMVTNLRTFFQEGRFRYYPDTDAVLYWEVYWHNDFRARLQRGGKYNLEVTLLER